MQNKAQQKLNKADENCEIKQQFLWTVTIYFCNWKQQELNFYGGATTNNKKNKGQGFTYFYIQNCQVLQYGRHWTEFGVLCLECVEIKKNWITIAKEKPVWKFNFKGNYC